MNFSFQSKFRTSSFFEIKYSNNKIDLKNITLRNYFNYSFKNMNFRFTQIHQQVEFCK